MRLADNNDTYWASAPAKDFIQEVHQRIRDFYDDLRDTELFYLIQKSYAAYYGGDLKDRGGSGLLFESSRLSRGGKQGEIVNFKTNHFRNLMKHTLQLATANKHSFLCRSTNSDHKSQTQAYLGNGILDYYMREKGLNRKFTEAVENGLILLEGWVHCPWDPEGGEIIAVQPETGAPIREGDLEFSVLTITDVVRDISLKEQAHDWLCVRKYENKWSLAARYPEIKDRILGETRDSFDYEDFESFNFSLRKGLNNSSAGDYIVTWVFYHKPTDALPEGRMISFTGEVVLFDGPTPYREIPVYQCSPDRLIGTPYGYSPAVELLGPQQALDILTSTIMTNQATNGVQNLWTQKGDDLSVKDLTGGMKHISSNEMPQALQLTATPVEIFNFRQTVIGEMETLSGISSTVRGNPESNLKSGSALALVVSQSVQFSSMLEASLITAMERVAMAIINQLRDFSQTKRVAAIIGVANRPLQQEFSSDDLSLINRVTIEPVSALSKTAAGKIEIANQLMERGMIENPRQYMTVLQTGQLDQVTEGVDHENLNIRAENEAIRRGEPVKALITDNHASHIIEHKTIIADPDARRNPQFVDQVLSHIQEHLDLWRTADAALLMITGQQPPPPPNNMTLLQEQQQPAAEGMMQPQQMQPQQMQPQQMPQPQGGIQAPIEPVNPSAPGEMMPNQPRMPSLPPGTPAQAQAAYEQQQGVLL